MRLLASYAMRGRSQAVMLAVVLALLSLLMLPLSIFSSAILALVTLRKGVTEAFIVLILGTIACGILSLLLLGMPFQVLSYVLFMWVPMVLFASVLRISRSLALTILSALALGLLLLVGQYLHTEDPGTQWRGIIEAVTKPLEDNQMISEADRLSLVTMLAKWMPGVIVAGFLLQSMVSIFTARWWQASLFNPGGFRVEFHQLRLPRILAVVTLPVLLMMLLGNNDGGHFWGYVAMLLIAAWFLHGLALAHGAVGLISANIGWLIGMYALLVFFMPHMMMVLAAAGFADVWFDFRARLGSEKI